MDNIDKVLDLTFRLFGLLPWWLQPLIMIVGAVAGVIYMSRFVEEGERGVILRFGKVRRYNFGEKKGQPKIKEPGWIIVVPKVDKLRQRHVREQTLELEPQEVILKDGSIFNVKGVVFFKVIDIYKALFEVNDLDGAMKNLCGGELRTVLQSLDGVDDIKDVENVSKLVLDITRSKTGGWGVEITGFRLPVVAPSKETSASITAGALVKARLAALKDAGVQSSYLAAALLGVPAVTTLQNRDEERPNPEGGQRRSAQDELQRLFGFA